MALPASSTQALTLHEQRQLLDFAHLALERYLRSAEALLAPPPGALVSPRLLAMQGAFVSLHRGRELRGCVGFPEPTRPLVRAVMENTVGAAGRDPRFHPVEGSRALRARGRRSRCSATSSRCTRSESRPGAMGCSSSFKAAAGSSCRRSRPSTAGAASICSVRCASRRESTPDAWQWPETRLYAFTAQVFADLAPGPESPGPRLTVRSVAGSECATGGRSGFCLASARDDAILVAG